MAPSAGMSGEKKGLTHNPMLVTIIGAIATGVVGLAVGAKAAPIINPQVVVVSVDDHPKEVPVSTAVEILQGQLKELVANNSRMAAELQTKDADLTRLRRELAAKDQELDAMSKAKTASEGKSGAVAPTEPERGQEGPVAIATIGPTPAVQLVTFGVYVPQRIGTDLRPIVLTNVNPPAQVDFQIAGKPHRLYSGDLLELKIDGADCSLSIQDFPDKKQVRVLKKC